MFINNSCTVRDKFRHLYVVILFFKDENILKST